MYMCENICACVRLVCMQIKIHVNVWKSVLLGGPCSPEEEKNDERFCRMKIKILTVTQHHQKVEFGLFMISRVWWVCHSVYLGSNHFNLPLDFYLNAANFSSILIIICQNRASTVLCECVQRQEKQPTSDLFNPLAPHIHFRGGRLLGAFRMRHEKHTQSSSIPEALALPNNAVAADPLPVPLNSNLTLKL